MTMKLFKLLIHQVNFSDMSLLINPKDWPQAQVGNIFQVYLPEDEYSRLLLQVQGFQDDFPPKDAISIEQSIANSFHLRPYAEVVVQEVSPKDVALDSVELFFKDQYLTRSDMWRLKESLVNNCVYSNKKIEFAGVRCQVYEMWSQGERVACGVLTEDTKIVYRSASSMVYLFIQMSKEMWDFDINGDLYFEKTVNGFLAELFAKWKKLNCNHDVTIVLFSRTFYEASKIEDFPSHMHECLQKDYKGRFYQDFYRVAVQNERYEDWSGVLILLKNIFNQYQDLVLEYHKVPGCQCPKAHNATSSQGNFLEVLNMSLNVFEKHYMDRSFDRTGQLSVVISPGVGIFEVDRGLTNVTKQRIIDNGIGSDLVCLGEQPLHAVPLFKFHNKQKSAAPLIDGDNYNMPHWINLSFYSSMKHNNCSNFVPRIKRPEPLSKSDQEKAADALQLNRARHSSQPEHAFPSKFDYEDYDNQVFKLPPHSLGNKTSPNQLTNIVNGVLNPAAHQNPKQYSRRTKKENSFLIKSEPGFNSGNTVDKIAAPQRSSAIVIPQKVLHFEDVRSSSVTFSLGPNEDDSQHREESSGSHHRAANRAIVGSAGSTYERPSSKQVSNSRLRALINPFDPSHITIKLTSNRRRWTHVFPLGPSGIFMQQHHCQVVPQNTAATVLPPSLDRGCHDVSQIMACAILRKTFQMESAQLVLNRHPPITLSGDHQVDRSINWYWSGDQEWTSALTTGVDWKSLVIPACLPITTDYFPDERSLQMDYVIADYRLLPEDIGMESVPRRCYREGEESHYLSSSALQVCRELVYQRLQQGFQVVMLPKELASHPTPQGSLSLTRATSIVKDKESYLLSIGRIYHKLSFEGSEITVTRFKPRHEAAIPAIKYCYRFQALDSEKYEVSRVDFVTENLHNYAWNHLDNYVCHRGTGEYQLKESQKFWRLRLLLLPSSNQATKQIIDGHSDRCDIYQSITSEDKVQQSELFIRFIEIVNRIRRPVTKRNKMVLGLTSSLRLMTQPTLGPRRFSLGTSLSSGQVLSQVSYANFRERVGSTGAARTRTQAKALDRVKADLSSTGRISSIDSAESRLSGSNTSLDGSSEVENDVLSLETKKLVVTSRESEIIEAMKHPTDGLTFVKQPGLPQWTFLSAEAVSWMQDHIYGLMGSAHAITFLKAFKDKNLIRHASGCDQDFINGFYLYSFTDKNSDMSTDQQDLQASQQLEVFQREWAEVEVLDPYHSKYESILADSEYHESPATDVYGTSRLHMKISNMNFPASGRSEWGQIKYHSYFQAGTAYELILEWMVASGNIVADLVLSWSRKATSLGFHLVPIPSDPFALLSSSKADPLRKPTFVPLCLTALSTHLSDQSLHHFQQKILNRFGFIFHADLSSQAPVLPEHEKQYVHVSGSFFVIILPGCLPQKQSTESCATQAGFMWSWNYMITKRWKTHSTGDEYFMRKVLNDFKEFCSNGHDRLQEFWESQYTSSCTAPLPPCPSLPFPS